LIADFTYLAWALRVQMKGRASYSAEQSDSDQQQKEFDMESDQRREPWNKGKLVGQKPPLKPKD